MGHTVKSVNSVGEGSVKTVNEIVKDDIKVLCGVHGFAHGDGPGQEAYDIDSIDKLTRVTNIGYGAVGDGRTGIIKPTGLGGWNNTWDAYAVSNVEITSGEDAYLQWTPTQNQAGGYVQMWFGLGYKSDLPGSGVLAGPGTWCNWSIWCNNGTDLQIYEDTAGGGSSSLEHATGGFSWLNDRTVRIQIVDNEVTYRYSSDGFESDDNEIFASTNPNVDIDANGNLICLFGIARFVCCGVAAAAACYEDVVVYGSLTNT